MVSKIQPESVLDKESNLYFEMNFGISKKQNCNVDVCDNSINLLVTKKTLETHGILVEVATNGLESIEKIKRTDYDIVLMYINMPIMNGIEATNEVRKLNKPVIVIALTAVTHDE
ncbi:response regulator [Formosa sp. PL04]|uniref:response regulator n=1 Tax=Formosa sp. PL04 TaxID=3081755 RepID=UPI002980C43B|nr:response regulator [Formosa sp. PL04]MDW5290155.1 response regulator [Formosa sp. PL04]